MILQKEIATIAEAKLLSKSTVDKDWVLVSPVSFLPLVNLFFHMIKITSLIVSAYSTSHTPSSTYKFLPTLRNPCHPLFLKRCPGSVPYVQ